MDDGRIGDEMTLEGIAKRLDEISMQLGSVQADVKSHDRRFQALDEKLQSLDGKLQSLDQKVTGLGRKMTIEFEETRRVVNLSFENAQMLDEKIDRRFDETDRAHADHKSVLESAIVSLGQDMKGPLRPGRRP